MHKVQKIDMMTRSEQVTAVLLYIQMNLQLLCHTHNRFHLA
jgi:hypothetical protein